MIYHSCASDILGPDQYFESKVGRFKFFVAFAMNVKPPVESISSNLRESKNRVESSKSFWNTTGREKHVQKNSCISWCFYLLKFLISKISKVTREDFLPSYLTGSSKISDLSSSPNPSWQQTYYSSMSTKKTVGSPSTPYFCQSLHTPGIFDYSGIFMCLINI